jgi:hypothetical protein
MIKLKDIAILISLRTSASNYDFVWKKS